MKQAERFQFTGTDGLAIPGKFDTKPQSNSVYV
jgi:hypothetical protein